MAKTILRPKEAMRRLGVGNTKFYSDFINTGRLRTVKLGTRAVGILEEDLDQLIADLPTREVSAR